MSTDWALVRAMMQAAIDTCEQIEGLGYKEEDRSAIVAVGDRTVSVLDILTSAWIATERLRYEIIRERHAKEADLPYVPETARILVGMAQACAELVGSQEAAPAKESIQGTLRWYSDHAVPCLRAALAAQSVEPTPRC